MLAGVPVRGSLSAGVDARALAPLQPAARLRARPLVHVSRTFIFFCYFFPKISTRRLAEKILRFVRFKVNEKLAIATLIP